MASGVFPTDDWTFSSGQVGDVPVMVRARSGFPSDSDRERLSLLVTATWQFETSEKTWLPDSATLDLMEEFENAVLEKADEDNWWGSGVAVITTPGKREWRFYTGNTEDFIREFSEALRGLGPYPLELASFDDKNWDALREWQSESL